MKKSKLNDFKKNELESLESLNVHNGLKGGASNTIITCYEPTGEPKHDTRVEEWPDGGGAVTSFVYKM